MTPILLAGPLLARYGSVLVPPPGGDVIGRRRIDTHLHAFAALGAEIEVDRDFMLRAPDGLAGARFFMDEPSVTATENAVMAAVELRGSSFDPDDLVAWLRRQPDLGTKWAPAFVRITDKLDETATGKITKVRLREEAWHADDPIWVRPVRADRYRPLTDADIADLDARLAARART